MVKVGIIGGSGLDDPKLLEDFEEREVETKFGVPSSKVSCGKISGVEVCILARHGKEHNIPPASVNYAANIAALKILGCDYIIGTSAVGSLREEIAPGDLVFPVQFVDFTKKRRNSFYEEVGDVAHCEMAEPFSDFLREKLVGVTREFGFRCHDGATVVVVEGPRFSTRAESNMFRGFADVVGMTTVPECCLAKEAGIPYASVAMATDYDCWRENTESVTFEMVLETMKKNAERVKKILVRVVGGLAPLDNLRYQTGQGFGGDTTPSQVPSKEGNFIKSKIRTVPNFPKADVMFRDITTLVGDAEGLERTIDVFYNRYKDRKIDAVVGIESRGFIFGAALAHRLGVGFVPVRKPGKLPGEVVGEEYALEYGTDRVEVHRDAISRGQRVLIIDDLIATGGTALATCNLVERLGGEIVECGFVVDLPDLRGKEKLSKWPVFCVVEFLGS